MKHLSDQEIQDYLDGSIGIERAEIEEHLLSCNACQRSRDAYQQLYLALSQEPATQLSTQFSDTIIAKITSETLKISQAAEWVLFTISAVVGVMILIFIMASNFSGSQIADFSSQVQQLLPVSGFLKVFPANNFNLFLFALVVLAAIGIFDKFILQNRLKRTFS